MTNCQAADWGIDGGFVACMKKGWLDIMQEQQNYIVIK